MNNDIDLRIRTVLADVFGVDASEIDQNTSMDTVDAWDSLCQLTVVLALEEEFDLHFDDEQTVALVSVPLINEIVAESLGVADAS